MAGVEYFPEFQHTLWSDNVDRVSAAGDNGFNVRFKALEAEFQRISDAIAQLSNAIEELGQAPPAAPVTLTLTPAFVQFLGDPWEHNQGTALKGSGKTAAAGAMPIQLPHGMTIQSFRATGQKEGSAGSLTIRLLRQRIVVGSGSDVVASIAPLPGVFDTTVAPSSALAKVDNTLFRYYIHAALTASPAALSVFITGFQITQIAQ